MLRTIRFLGLLGMTGAVLSAQQCSTPSGATVPDGQVNAAANFTTGQDFITVTLSNQLADPVSAGQLLSGLAFTLSGGVSSGTLGMNTANIRRVNAGGSFMDYGPGSTGWALEQNFNGGFFLCVLCTDLGAAGPHDLLIGSPAADNNYDSSNASIAGNRPHNPFTSDIATFHIDAPGVTANSTITSVTFFFSTTEGVSVAGTCSGPSPIPL